MQHCYKLVPQYYEGFLEVQFLTDAWPWKFDIEDSLDAAGIEPQYHNSACQQYRFFYVMGDEKNCFACPFLAAKAVEADLVDGSGTGIEGPEWFSISNTGELMANALAIAALWRMPPES